MQRKTLLELVQSALNVISSDEVSSIDETTESIQVAELAKDIYMEWTSRDDWPFEKSLIQLQGLSDVSHPNYLKLQEEIAEINKDNLEIKYEVTESGDTSRTFRTIEYMVPSEFLDMLLTRDTSDTDNIQEVTDFSGIDLFIEKTKKPQFWTSFDDDYIIFDSYDNSVDTTLQQSKTIAYAIVSPEWERSNTFIPEMPAKMFPAFQAELNSNVFYYFKDQVSMPDDKRALRGMSMLRRKAGRANNAKTHNKYGRR